MAPGALRAVAARQQHRPHHAGMTRRRLLTCIVAAALVLLSAVPLTLNSDLLHRGAGIARGGRVHVLRDLFSAAGGGGGLGRRRRHAGEQSPFHERARAAEALDAAALDAKDVRSLQSHENDGNGVQPPEKATIRGWVAVADSRKGKGKDTAKPALLLEEDGGVAERPAAASASLSRDDLVRRWAWMRRHVRAHPCPTSQNDFNWQRVSIVHCLQFVDAHGQCEAPHQPKPAGAHRRKTGRNRLGSRWTRAPWRRCLEAPDDDADDTATTADTAGTAGTAGTATNAASEKNSNPASPGGGYRAGIFVVKNCTKEVLPERERSFYRHCVAHHRREAKAMKALDEHAAAERIGNPFPSVARFCSPAQPGRTMWWCASSGWASMWLCLTNASLCARSLFSPRRAGVPVGRRRGARDHVRRDAVQRGRRGGAGRAGRDGARPGRGGPAAHAAAAGRREPGAGHAAPPPRRGDRAQRHQEQRADALLARLRGRGGRRRARARRVEPAVAVRLRPLEFPAQHALGGAPGAAAGAAQGAARHGAGQLEDERRGRGGPVDGAGGHPPRPAAVHVPPARPRGAEDPPPHAAAQQAGHDLPLQLAQPAQAAPRPGRVPQRAATGRAARAGGVVRRAAARVPAPARERPHVRRLGARPLAPPPPRGRAGGPAGAVRHRGRAARAARGARRRGGHGRRAAVPHRARERGRAARLRRGGRGARAARRALAGAARSDHEGQLRRRHARQQLAQRRGGRDRARPQPVLRVGHEPGRHAGAQREPAQGQGKILQHVRSLHGIFED